MNCTQCGAPIQKGQKFCVHCGAALTGAPSIPAEQPKLDLSAYFDSAPTVPEESIPDNLFDFPAQPQTRPAPKPQPAPRPQTRPAPQPQVYPAANPPRQPQPVPRMNQTVPLVEEPKTRKGDRGLNIALIICTVLAVAVLTFVVILLVSQGKDESGQNRPVEDYPPVVTDTTQGGEIPAPTITNPPTVIVTPTTLPDTSSPTPSPTPTPTPTPTPAPEYLLPESNTRYLTEADLSGLTHEQLCFARNEIFARHGRIFKTPEIAAYFNSKSWYHGTVSPENFSESVFNAYERYNISLIRDYENKYYGGSYY